MRQSARGFTLLEVMIGLALLGLALVILIQSAGSSIVGARSAQMMGVVTDLSRAKMYDIEEKLLKDGFSDTDQGEDGKTFEEEGWANIRYSYKVEEIELPSFEDLQAMAQGKQNAALAGSGSGSGSGAGSNALDAFQNSTLGGMLSQLGGGFGGASQGIDSKQGAGLVQGLYPIFQQTLKLSIRKVTLTVKWDLFADENELKTVAFFVDPAAMDKVLQGFGATDPADSGTGTGSGSGSGSGGRPGTGSGGTTRPPVRPPVGSGSGK